MIIGMGLLHFGDLIKFISKTITVGFTLGIAVRIIVGQIKDLFCANIDVALTRAASLEK